MPWVKGFGSGASGSWTRTRHSLMGTSEIVDQVRLGKRFCPPIEAWVWRWKSAEEEGPHSVAGDFYSLSKGDTKRYGMGSNHRF